MTYNSNLTPVSQPLFQADPQFEGIRDPQTSWTYSVRSYIKAASHLAACVSLNQSHYPWTATINIEQVMSAQDVSRTWKNITRNLKHHNVTCLWVREISRNNRVHYHLLIKGKHDKPELQQLLRTSIPDNVPHRIHVAGIKCQMSFPRYIFKADKHKHRHKRLLFKPKLGITKHNTVGKFWFPSRRVLSDFIMAKCKHRPNAGLVNPDVGGLAYYMWTMLGNEVMSLRDMRRRYGFVAVPEYAGYWDAYEALEREDDIEHHKAIHREAYDKQQLEIQHWKENERLQLELGLKL